MTVIYINESNSPQLDELNKIIKNLGEDAVVPLDTEGTDKDPILSQLISIQLKIDEDCYVIHIPKIGKEEAMRLVLNLSESKARFVMHNAKYDIKHIYSNIGIWIPKVHDTMWTNAMLIAGRASKKDLYISLSNLVYKYFGEYLDKDTREEFIKFDISKDMTNEQIMYSANDVLYLEKIYYQQLSEVRSASMERVLILESNLVPVVARMEYVGIYLDKDDWSKLEKEAYKHLKKVDGDISDLLLKEIPKLKNGLEVAEYFRIPVRLVGDRKALEAIKDTTAISGWLRDNINYGSTKQRARVIRYLTGEEVESTSKKALALMEKSRITDLFLERSDWYKRYTTYGSSFFELINPKTGKIHTEYGNIGTATGRFSSSKPNMQQIPNIPGYRECFKPSKGFSFIAMDYSQQEYRLAGAISKEPVIIESYMKGIDMHTMTGAFVYGVKPEEVTKEERSFGKTLNFAVLYGTSKFGLRRNLRISLQEAEELINKFYGGYPVLASFKAKAEEMILKLGYSVTPLGRRRYVEEKPIFMSANEYDNYIARVKRECFNHIIQGAGADIIKLAMVKMDNENPFDSGLLRLILQIHDEIVVEVHDDLIDQAIPYMKYCMESVYQPFLGQIPAETDYKVLKEWSK